MNYKEWSLQSLYRVSLRLGAGGHPGMHCANSFSSKNGSTSLVAGVLSPGKLSEYPEWMPTMLLTQKISGFDSVM